MPKKESKKHATHLEIEIQQGRFNLKSNSNR